MMPLLIFLGSLMLLLVFSLFLYVIRSYRETKRQGRELEQLLDELNIPKQD